MAPGEWAGPLGSAHPARLSVYILTCVVCNRVHVCTILHTHFQQSLTPGVVVNDDGTFAYFFKIQQRAARAREEAARLPAAVQEEHTEFPHRQTRPLRGGQTARAA